MSVAVSDQGSQRKSAVDAGRPSATKHVFEIAPEEELLYSLSADGRRKFIHPIVRRGRIWRIRHAIAVTLCAVFFALPLIPVGDYPAVLLDISARRFHVFGTTFHPTDNILLALFGFGVLVTVFFVGSTFGRMWCGFACPQTVYLEFVFRPIEALLEGGPHNQRKLNAAPWDARKLAIKTAKWSIWSLIALVMASTFVAYFTGWSALIGGMATDPLAWSGALFTIALVTAAIVFDFGWFRDQMCTIACPYGRLQNVMADQDTIVVAYDTARGEPRRKMKDRRPELISGDCVDCRQCIAVCPTGTDIRRGLQPECLGTGLCIDACDEVMRKLGKPTGLIRFTSEREQKGGIRRLWRPRTIVYLALMTIAWGTLAGLVLTRSSALVEIVRGGREPYRLLPTGDVANQQRVRITNQLAETQSFTIEVVSPAGATLVVSESPIVVRPESTVATNAVTTVPRGIFVDGQATVVYRVRSDRGFEKDVSFVLLGPFGSPGGTP